MNMTNIIDIIDVAASTTGEQHELRVRIEIDGTWYAGICVEGEQVAILDLEGREFLRTSGHFSMTEALQHLEEMCGPTADAFRRDVTWFSC